MPRKLTRREIDVLGLLADGETAAGIAAALGIALQTVRSTEKLAYRRLGARNAAHAVALAMRADPIIERKWH